MIQNQNPAARKCPGLFCVEPSGLKNKTEFLTKDAFWKYLPFLMLTMFPMWKSDYVTQNISAHICPVDHHIAGVAPKWEVRRTAASCPARHGAPLGGVPRCCDFPPACGAYLCKRHYRTTQSPRSIPNWPVALPHGISHRSAISMFFSPAAHTCVNGTTQQYNRSDPSPTGL